MPVADDFFIYHILNSLCKEFEHLKISCNAYREKWGIYDLTLFVPEDGRMNCNNSTKSSFDFRTTILEGK